MNTRPMLCVSTAALAVFCLAGCDQLVTLENHSSASVYILAPGEEAGFLDPLGPGQSREAEVAEGPTIFTVLDEDGEVIATGECEVPGPDPQTGHLDYLFVIWTGSEITCELAPDPESAGGGTAGRLIPSGIYWPPLP